MKNNKETKDHCTLFPEFWNDVYIGDCCHLHDIECGFSGSYNIKKSIDVFYNCLNKKISKTSAILITIGGTLGYLFKLPKLFYNKYRYNKYNIKP